MSEKPRFSAKQLLEAVRSLNTREFRLCIEGIGDQNPDAEKVVASVLNHLLVQKKDKSPPTLFNALMLYKQLLIAANMDYLCNEQFFPRAVHEQLGKICEYRKGERNIDVQGSNYFVDVFGAEPSQANKKVGQSYVLLALQMLRAMARLYPLQYDDKSVRSIFNDLFQGLVAKKVVFPDSKEMFSLKDQESFIKNYAAFEKDQRELLKEDEQESIKKKVPQSEIKTGKSQKDISPQIIVSAINKSQNGAKSALGAIDSKAGQFASQIRQQPSIPKQQRLSLESKSLSDKSQMLRIDKPLKSLGNQPQEEEIPERNTLNIETKFTEELKSVYEREAAKKTRSQIPVEKTVVRSQVAEIVSIPPAPVMSVPLNMQGASVLSNVETPKKSKPSGSKKQESKFKEPGKPVVQSPSNIQLQRMRNESQQELKQSIHSKKEMQNSKKYSKQQNIMSFGPQKGKKIQIVLPQEQYIPLKPITTPKKLYKIQKPHHIQSFQTSPHLNAPQNNSADPIQAFPFQRSPGPNLQKRLRSLPKTQRHKWNQFPTNFKYSSKEQQKRYLDEVLDNIPSCNIEGGPLDHERDIFNKTLSYFANSRKKKQHPFVRQLEKYHSVGAVVEKMRLDREYLHFNIRYFEPLTLQMQSLREQALNLFNSGCSYNAFYFSMTIEARLLKQGNFSYLLSLHNISGKQAIIDYVQLQSLRFSSRVKVVSWGNREQIAAVVLSAGGYFDIRFQFDVYDLNFKFLAFPLLVNQQSENLVLPLTLLDMCEISPIIDLRFLQQYSLKGSILASEPFTLRSQGLPAFLGGFKFSELSARREHSSLIGQCRLQLEKTDRRDLIKTDLHILVKLMDSASRACLIEILYLTKEQQALDLSKVVIYLLIFLLAETA